MRILSNFAAIAIVLLASNFSIAQLPAPLFEWTFDDADTVPNSSFAFSSASETLPNCVTAVDRSESVSVELSITDDAVATLDTSAWEVEPACFTVANWGFGFGHDMNAGAPQSFTSDDLSQFELSFDARVAGTEDLRSTVRVQFLEFNDEGEEPTVWAELNTREADGATDFRPLITSDQQTFTTTLDQLDFADGFMLESLTENLTRISGVNFEFDVEGRSGEGSFDTDAIIGLDSDNEFILDNIQLVAPFDELPTLTIENFVINNSGGTAAATDWVLSATDGADFTLVDVQGGDDVTNINVPIGTYAITATGGPGGYGQTGFGCSGSADTDFTDGIDLASGENVVCTFAHDDISPSLTIRKTVVNDNGGTAVASDWTVAASGPTNISGASGSADVTNAEVNAGEYTVGDFPGGPEGYARTDLSCVGGSDSDPSNGLSIELGENIVCTITDDDISPNLTLTNTVVNDDGGTAVAADWRLAAVGPNTISGSVGDSFIDSVDVDAGNYTLSQSGGPDGYELTDLSCSGGDLDDDLLSLALGETVICNFVNDDIEIAGPCDPDTLGDVNGDGVVAFADFLVLSSNFGLDVDDHTAGDINCDGTVGFADFLVQSSFFGQNVNNAEAVPEPNSGVLALFAIGIAAVLRRRR